MSPRTLTYRINDWFSLHINQAERGCLVVEVLKDYSLAIYTMPNGRAFLTRLLHTVPEHARPQEYYANASKKERDRHEVAILNQEILAREDKISEIQCQRLPRYRIEGRCNEHRRQIATIKAKLETLAAAKKDA